MSLSSKIHIVNTARIVIATRKQKALSVSLPFNIKAITKGGNNMEIWKDIEGYEGLYQVSTFGNVRSLNYRNRGFVKNLTPKRNNKGYLWVELVKNKRRKCFLIHRLVAMAFIDNPEGFEFINHKDEEPSNCDVSNLEWCSRSYNVRYSIERHPERYKRKTIKRNKCPKIRYKKYLINQLSLDGKFVNRWTSFWEIGKALNYRTSSLKECCEGKRKTAYGYKWEFAD